ncbi:uncharacterized protein LOC123552856 [Mercenaria mercenaria]|uniref:uncharacterized protein LOC123552856 n=1 Tax=Mercenaria mercenaria TaxID=6596 RepID=UPI00234F2E33|nr:uncharacterized protein LOC123552856 [Mercenaria mercenaria]
MRKITRQACQTLGLFFSGLFVLWVTGNKNSQSGYRNAREVKHVQQWSAGTGSFGNKVSKVANSKPDVLLPDQFAISLLKRGKKMCDSNLIAYGHFAKVTNIVLDPSFGKLTQEGNSKNESYSVDPGFFQMECNGKIDVKYPNRMKHLNSWANAIKIGLPNDKTYETITDWTIAVSRNHNNSIYYTMSDIYNAFLLSRAFDIDPEVVDVIFIDGYPENKMNSTWARLFQKVTRIEEVKKPVLYKNMIWGLADNDSPLNFEYKFKSIPNLEEFRKFVLRRHEVDFQHKLDCTNLNVLILNKNQKFIEFKNAHGHPEKIYENMLYQNILEIFSDHRIVLFPFQATLQDQLKVISKIDIFISLHTEELTHVMFLPKHAVVLEIFKLDVTRSDNMHYQALAQWRNMSYYSWGGTEIQDLTKSASTFIQGQISHIAGEMFRQMCIPSYKKSSTIWN